MTIKERRIFHINDLVSNIDNAQFCFEPIEDPDLNFRMFGYKTDDSDIFKCLSKDQNGRVNDFGILGFMTTNIDMNIHSIEHATYVSGSMDDGGENSLTRLVFHQLEVTQAIELYSLLPSGQYSGLTLTTGATADPSAVLEANVSDLDMGLFLKHSDSVIGDKNISMRMSTGPDLIDLIGKISIEESTGVSIHAYNASTGSVSLYGATNVQFSNDALWDSTWISSWKLSRTGENGIADFTALETAAGGELSIVEMFLALYGGIGGQSTIEEGAVGYGDESNLLTGDATDLAWDTSVKQLKVGPGPSPTWLGEASGIMLTGHLEMSGSGYVGGEIYFGLDDEIEENTPFARVGYKTWATSQALELATDNTNKNVIIHSVLNNIDFGHAAQDDPTLWIESEAATDKSIYFRHNKTNALMGSTFGGIQLQDTYYLGPSGTGGYANPILIAHAAQDYKDLHDDWSGDYSILELLHKLKTAGGGGGLDYCYDFGGSGAGKAITTDSGAVALTTPSGVDGTAFVAGILNAAQTSEVMQIYNQSTAGAPSIFMQGNAGGSVWGQQIKADDRMSLRISEVGYDDETLTAFAMLDFDGTEDSSYSSSMLKAYCSAEGYHPSFVKCSAYYNDIMSGSQLSRIDGGADQIALTSYGPFDIMCENALWITTNDGTSAGTTIDIEAYGLLTLESASGNVKLDPYGYVDASSKTIRNVQNLSFGSACTDKGAISGGTLTIDWTADKPIIKCTASADITTLSMTAPNGCQSMVIRIAATTTGIDIGGGSFNSDITWLNEIALSTAQGLTNGKIMEIRLVYYDSTAKYTGSVIIQP
jgi:hypothetical protein